VTLNDLTKNGRQMTLEDLTLKSMILDFNAWANNLTGVPVYVKDRIDLYTTAIMEYFVREFKPEVE